MIREIGIDYLFPNGTENDKEIIENGLKMFSFSCSFFNGKEFQDSTRELWVMGNREDALILINEWNRKAFIQANKTSMYSYHLNP